MDLWLTKRPQRTKALLIAFYGRRNPIACECCVRRYSSIGFQRAPLGSYEPLPYPFDECVSLPGHWFGACSNCMFLMCAPQCSYHILSKAGESSNAVDSDESGMGIEFFDEAEKGNKKDQIRAANRRGQSSLSLKRPRHADLGERGALIPMPAPPADYAAW